MSAFSIIGRQGCQATQSQPKPPRPAPASIRSTPFPPFFSFRWPEKRLLTLLATTKKTMANREDLLDLVGKVEPRTVLLSHGEADSLTWFTAQIHARYPKIKIIQPKPGVAVEI